MITSCEFELEVCPAKQTVSPGFTAGTWAPFALTVHVAVWTLAAADEVPVVDDRGAVVVVVGDATMVCAGAAMADVPGEGGAVLGDGAGPAAVGAATSAASVCRGSVGPRAPVAATTASTSAPTSMGTSRCTTGQRRSADGSPVWAGRTRCGVGEAPACGRWLVDGPGAPWRSAAREAINSVTSSRPSGELEVRDTTMDGRSAGEPTRRT
ncbi:MAG TPA: hypothetical protein VGE11_04535 [Pseudonocardia sp.]